MSAYDFGCKPFWDQVILELLVQRESKKGDLYIPETVTKQNEPFQGTIVAIGPGKEDIDMSVFAIGQQVLARQYAGTEFERDGKKYLVIRASDIMCEVIA